MILLQLSSLLSSLPTQELCSYNMSLKTILKRCEAHRQILEVMQDQGFLAVQDADCPGERHPGCGLIVQKRPLT
jgi:hypothetical protein